MRHYCTYFDYNYIKQGLALHASMERHCQPYHLWILALCDEAWAYLSRRVLPNVTVVKLEGFETTRLAVARRDRTWQEYMWTLTPSWMLYVLRRQGQVSYIDADCFFFASPEPVFDEIGSAPLGITPHRFSPKYEKFGINGLYNVGLVYATEEGQHCINEWAAQCIEWCYYRNEDDKFADQKYLDAWPEKWGAHPIEHLGANLAPWNQEQYTYALDNGDVLIDCCSLVWYHFHQGLTPQWQINDFVKSHIYPPYEVAFKIAEKSL